MGAGDVARCAAMKQMCTSARALLVLSLAVGCGGGRGASPAAARGALRGDDSIALGAALPAGQLIQIGGPRLSHASKIEQVDFAAGGALVSAAGGHLRVWEPSGALRWQSFELDSSTRFAVSGDGALIAAAHARLFADGRTTIYEVSGRERQRLSLGSVDALAFSPDAQRLVVVNPQLTVFELGQGQRVGMLNQDALAVSFADDDTVIAVSRDGVRRWSWRTGKVEVVQAFPTPPDAVALARGGESVAWTVRVAAGSAVHVLQLDGTSARSEVTVPGPVRGLALSPLGDAVALSLQGGFGVWTTGEGARLKWSLPDPGMSRAALAFSSTGERLITGMSGRVATLEAERGAYERASEDRTIFYDFDPSGDPLVSRGEQLWRVELPGGGRALVEAHVLTDSPGWASDFAYGAGGLLMGWDALATLDCKPLRLWLRGAAERTLPAPGDCDAEAGEAWFPGPGWVLSGGKRPQVWDAVKERQVFRLPERPQRLVDASFSVDQRLLVMVFLTEEQEEERGHGYAGSPDGDDDEDDEGDDDGDGDGDGDGDDGLREEERAAQAAMDHDGDGYDPSLEVHYVVEVVDLTKLAGRGPEGWAPTRSITWYEKAPLDGAVILNDGTIFVGAEDGRVLAAAPGADELLEVARLTSSVTVGRASPTGAAAAMTDDDARTVLFSAAVARASAGR